MKADYKTQAAQALESLEGMQRAEPAPYFYTRLSARLAGEEPLNNFWVRLFGFFTRPAVVIAMALIILFTNLFVLLTPDKFSDDAQNLVVLNDHTYSVKSIYNPEE